MSFLLHYFLVLEMVNELLLALHSGELNLANFFTFELTPFPILKISEEL
jgi:hypothetical protein